MITDNSSETVSYASGASGASGASSASNASGVSGASGASSMSVVPNDILAEIFKFSGDERVIHKYFSRISRHFYDVIHHHPELQKHLCDSGLCSRYHTKAKYTSIRNINEGLVLKEDEPIHILEFNSYSINEYVANFIIQTIDTKKIHTLILNYCDTTLHFLQAIIDSLKKTNSVHTLNFESTIVGYITNVNDYVVPWLYTKNENTIHFARTIANFMIENSTIRSINLRSIFLDADGFLEIIRALQQNTSIHTINLSDTMLASINDITEPEDTYMVPFVRMLSQNKTLRYVDFSMNDVDERYETIFAEIQERSNGRLIINLDW
jgi:hypothetical protein